MNLRVVGYLIFVSTVGIKQGSSLGDKVDQAPGLPMDEEK